MKKTLPKKLHLAKQTVRILTPAQLGSAQGGTDAKPVKNTPACPG